MLCLCCQQLEVPTSELQHDLLQPQMAVRRWALLFNLRQRMLLQQLERQCRSGGDQASVQQPSSEVVGDMSRGLISYWEAKLEQVQTVHTKLLDDVQRTANPEHRRDSQLLLQQASEF